MQPLDESLLRRFLRCEAGVTSIEYGLIASLVAVAAIPAVATMGGKLSGTLETVADAIKDKGAPPATPGDMPDGPGPGPPKGGP